MAGLRATCVLVAVGVILLAVHAAAARVDKHDFEPVYDGPCAGFPHVMPRQAFTFRGLAGDDWEDMWAVGRLIRNMLGTVTITAHAPGTRGSAAAGANAAHAHESGGKGPVLVVGTEADADSRLNTLRALVTRRSSVTLSPIGDTDLFVDRDAELTCKHRDVATIHLVLLVVGLVLVVNARYISKSATVYFATGVSVGALLSVLLVVIIIALQFRNRIGQALVVLFGFAGTTWVASNTLLSEAGSLAARLQPYWHYLAGYVAIASVLTFAYLYIKGPPTNPRTHNVIWVCVKFVGFVCVYCSTLWFPGKVALAAGALVVPSVLAGLARTLYGCCGIRCCGYGRSHYKPIYISVSEYERQTRDTTEREMARLKQQIRRALPVSRSTAHMLVDDAIEERPMVQRRRFGVQLRRDGGLVDPDDESDIDDGHWAELRRSPSPRR